MWRRGRFLRLTGRVIDGGGRTLMPGLIEAHWHTMLASLPVAVMMTADVGDIHFATSQNACILNMSGPRNPYPGTLGVIQKGSHADMILCEGNPTENLDLVADPDTNFRIIMKAGMVQKKTLAA